MGAAGSIDAPAQLAAVTRTVVFSNEEGQSRYSVILSQDHPLAARDLWPALSDAGRLAQWFAVVGGDLRAGGTYAIANNATGTIERCQAPLGFSVSWEYEGELSRVGVRLDAREDATTLRLEHVCDIDGRSTPNTGPGRSASAGTWPCWDWRSTSSRARASPRKPPAGSRIPPRWSSWRAPAGPGPTPP